ncbi:hypothetical protein ACIQUG_22275 [Ensifer sp. NPDC090286]|uniref:hypothetical protein n=1 Tax=Ensifer sp. NPDC090286 TaxID=3363991 RepID=UPI00383B877D
MACVERKFAESQRAFAVNNQAERKRIDQLGNCRQKFALPAVGFATIGSEGLDEAMQAAVDGWRRRFPIDLTAACGRADLSCRVHCTGAKRGSASSTLSPLKS